jgi:hypothetical protein
LIPTITAAQIDRDINEHQVLGKIAEAFRDANLTPLQAIDVLAGGRAFSASVSPRCRDLPRDRVLVLEIVRRVTAVRADPGREPLACQ